MSDVEKYGLFAVVFVGGLLLVVAFQGGFGKSTTPVLASGPAPVVIEEPVALGAGPRGSAETARRPVEVQVRPLMSDAPFRHDEPPVAYHGPRSASGPRSSTPPAVTAPAPATAPTTAAHVHVIAEGDTLAKLALRYLGSEARWQELAALNPGVDPKRLKLGQELTVRPGPTGTHVAQAPAVKPAKPEPAKPASGPRIHVVQSGDTLSRLALTYLGSVTRADELFAANRSVLKSPDDLKPGQTLRIP